MDEIDICRRFIEPYITEMRRALQSLPQETPEPEMQKEIARLEEAIRQLEALADGG